VPGVYREKFDFGKKLNLRKNLELKKLGILKKEHGVLEYFQPIRSSRFARYN